MSEHFNYPETSCRCGCGYNPVSDVLLGFLEDLRAAINEQYATPETGEIGLNLNCVCRCPDHNAAVGGVPNSQHVEGTAADIDVTTLPIDVDTLADLCVSLNADGVGRYPNFVHADVRDGRVGSGAAWDER